MTKYQYDYVIVGAGLYGSVFAYMLAQTGAKILVIDKRDHIGGNVATEKVHGINVHKYGAHIFHTNDRNIWEFVNVGVKMKPYHHEVKAYNGGRYYSLPFNMNTFNEVMNIQDPKEAEDYIKFQQSLQKGHPKNLEEKAISLVGPHIYEKLIKTYTKKQWNKDPKDLPSSIITRLPVRYTFNNSYFNDKYVGIPEDGYNELFEKLLDAENIDVSLKTDYYSEREYFDSISPKLLFTGMIDEFFDYELGELEYRSLVFKNQVHWSDNVQGAPVINYTGDEAAFTRRMEWRHFDGHGDSGVSITTDEYPVDYSRGSEPYYPVNDKKNNSLYHKYVMLAKEYNEKSDHKVIFGGRLGSYAYYDMDDTINAALRAADKELHENTFD